MSARSTIKETVVRRRSRRNRNLPFSRFVSDGSLDDRSPPIVALFRRVGTRALSSNATAASQFAAINKVEIRQVRARRAVSDHDERGGGGEGDETADRPSNSRLSVSISLPDRASSSRDARGDYRSAMIQVCRGVSCGSSSFLLATCVLADGGFHHPANSSEGLADEEGSRRVRQARVNLRIAGGSDVSEQTDEPFLVSPVRKNRGHGEKATSASREIEYHPV